jgi:glycosyltransferase involved in cell wall biosynthesis
LEDQFEILSERQRELPRIYLEHEPPREHPTDTRHLVDDPNTLLVHVTPFNALMWDSGRTPTRVIDQGVVVPEGLKYSGELPRGLVIVNNLSKGGRRLGLDLFERARSQVPLDLVGINSEQLGGLGSLGHSELLELEAKYRFIFSPIRYTSLGLSICEAMMLGIPVVGMATTEMVTAIENGVSGYLDTDLDRLIPNMNRLLQDPEEAQFLGRAARRQAQKRFSIQRFTSDWDEALSAVRGIPAMTPARRLQESRV